MADKKVAIITGGGSGMGADSARRRVASGFNVASMSSSGKGEALANELGGVTRAVWFTQTKRKTKS